MTVNLSLDFIDLTSSQGRGKNALFIVTVKVSMCSPLHRFLWFH